MSDDLWDDPDLVSTSTYVLFDAVGDTASGVIVSVGKKHFPATATMAENYGAEITYTPDAGNTVGVKDPNRASGTIAAPEGEDLTATCSALRLKAQLKELRPKVGDHIKITMTQLENRGGGKTLKHWNVEVDPGNLAAAPAFAHPPVQPNPEPVTTPTPEQIAAWQAQQAAQAAVPASPAAVEAAAAPAVVDPLAGFTPEQRAQIASMQAPGTTPVTTG